MLDYVVGSLVTAGRALRRLFLLLLPPLLALGASALSRAIVQRFGNNSASSGGNDRGDA